jgi:hypothetical protein
MPHSGSESTYPTVQFSGNTSEAPSGLATLVGMLISKIRNSDADDAVAAAEDEEEGELDDEAAEESAPVAESDDAPEDSSDEESEEATAEEPVAESDETTAEDAEEPSDAEPEGEETETAEPVAEAVEEGEKSEVAAESDAVAAEAPEPTNEPAEDEDTADSNSIEIEDPLKALDHSVARASLEVEQIEAEVDRLLGVYAVSVDKSKDEFRTVTPETIGYEIARTERRAARRVELEERRSEVDDLKQSVGAAQTEVNARQDKSAETSGGVTHAEEGWQEWLFGVDLDPEMTVAQVRRVVETLEPIRSHVTACEALEEQVAKLRGDVNRIETRIRNLADSSLDESVSVDLCYSSLDRVAIGINTRISRAADMNAELRLLEKDRAEADAEWNEADFKMQSVLDEAGAADEMEFRSLVEGAAKRREFSTMLETLRFETPMITGIDAKAVKDDLTEINHERAQAELAELPERIDRLHTLLSLLEQDLVGYETELAHLPEIPVDVESSLENGQHSTPSMASILGRPLSDQVIATAVRFLRMLTDDAYTGIEMVPSEDRRNTIGYKIIDNEGVSMDPREVDSSALFMALRAGAAEVHGSTGGSVPMVLNDFFGALAPADSRTALGGLAALSANKQVISVTSDARAGARFAVQGDPDQIHIVDATDLESPFKEVKAG